jgi:hypothetical protein
MRLLTAHFADDQKPLTTLCGMPWEHWQDPDVPSNAEIGFDDLSYGAKVAVREADRAREPQQGDLIQQCPACFKAVLRQ